MEGAGGLRLIPTRPEVPRIAPLVSSSQNPTGEWAWRMPGRRRLRRTSPVSSGVEEVFSKEHVLVWTCLFVCLFATKAASALHACVALNVADTFSVSALCGPTDLLGGKEDMEFHSKVASSRRYPHRTCRFFELLSVALLEC